MTKTITLAAIDNLKSELDALPVLSPEVKDKLERKFRLEFHFNSNHIEGNTLTYGETELLIIFDETRGNHTLREYEEMRASDVAYAMIMEAAENKTPISEAFIKNLNKILLVRPYWKEAITPDKQQTQRKITVGDYKKQPNSVLLSTGEMFNYATPQDTPIQMGELLSWLQENINDQKLHPVELAALLHYKFVLIHPFDDGNGRISRLLMNYVFHYFGYPPVLIKTDDKTAYLNSLHDADIGNIDSFIIYIGKQLIWSLNLSIQAASGEDFEDKQDWKKELALLKKELSNKVEIKEKKSSSSIQKLFNTSIIPMVNYIIEDTNEISNLFLKNYIWMKGSGSYATYPLMHFTEEAINKEYLFHLELRFLYKEFKQNGANVFNIETILFFAFDEFTFSLMFEEENILTKFYHEDVSLSDVQIISNMIGKSLISKIKDNLSKV
jgi:Fic family protein